MLGKLTKTLWETSTIGIGYKIAVERQNPIEVLSKPVKIGLDVTSPLGLVKRILR